MKIIIKASLLISSAFLCASCVTHEHYVRGYSDTYYSPGATNYYTTSGYNRDYRSKHHKRAKKGGGYYTSGANSTTVQYNQTPQSYYSNAPQSNGGGYQTSNSNDNHYIYNGGSEDQNHSGGYQVSN